MIQTNKKKVIWQWEIINEGNSRKSLHYTEGVSYIKMSYGPLRTRQPSLRHTFFGSWICAFKTSKRIIIVTWYSYKGISAPPLKFFPMSGDLFSALIHYFLIKQVTRQIRLIFYEISAWINIHNKKLILSNLGWCIF